MHNAKKYCFATVTAVQFFSHLILSTANACTTFCLFNGKDLIFGRNYDFPIGYGHVVINKRGVFKSAMADAGEQAAQWTAKYGSLTFNQFGRDNPMGGMNEAGLIVELMQLNATQYLAPDSRPALGCLEWIQYQLDNCATVNEAIKQAEKVRIRSHVGIHYLIADSKGEIASVEFLDGKLLYHRGDKMPVKALTNSTYEESLAYMKRFESNVSLPASMSSLDRFVHAGVMAKNYKPNAPYNLLGYSYRSVENYTEAEKAFQKYIKLIPDDPNPYDSYAELLLKLGRFDESIKQYQAALSRNPNFVASYIGISTDLSLQNKHAEAITQLQKLYDIARNDGERRAALFAKTVVYVDAGNVQMALAEMDKQYALAEKINDAAAMSGDLGAMGNILYESGKYDEALAKFEKSLQLTEASNLSAAIKENAKRGQLYNAGRVALMKKDVAAAKVKAAEFRAQSEAAKNTFQIWLAHELAGSIALAEKNYDQAIAQFQQANQQNPYTLYRLALAYEGKGDTKKAKELCQKAARFNALSNLNYSFMRKKAEQKLAAMPRS
jgi:choloylglycine hydrolase